MSLHEENKRRLQEAEQQKQQHGRWRPASDVLSIENESEWRYMPGVRAKLQEESELRGGVKTPRITIFGRVVKQ